MVLVIMKYDKHARQHSRGKYAAAYPEYQTGGKRQMKIISHKRHRAINRSYKQCEPY